MLPRVKGFIALVEGLRGGSVSHVYDVTLAYEGWESEYGSHPGPGGILMFLPIDPKKAVAFHVHVRRIALKDLPKVLFSILVAH
jgi:hypothetical protein